MAQVILPPAPVLAGLAAAGVAVGLGLLARGLGAYRRARTIGGTAASRISSLAAGEVLVTGAAEAAEVLLVSPLQSTECVYYRSRITETRDDDSRDVLREDRAIGFRVRDPSGSIRVFPRGARFDVPDRFDETSGLLSDAVGLRLRAGPPYAPGPIDRDARIADLLTVRTQDGSTLGPGGLSLGSSEARRHYREARIEPGDIVTVVGRALPFADLTDPSGANSADAAGLATDDPEVAGDLAEARAAGLLETSPEEAWGNAAIPGFGIGRPVRPPELDPAANALPIATEQQAKEAQATFEIPPETLVLAASPEVALSIALGAPGAVEARASTQFVIGLFGALLSIASAMALAFVLSGSLR